MGIFECEMEPAAKEVTLSKLRGDGRVRHLSLTTKVMFAEQVMVEFGIVERATIARSCAARSPSLKSDN